MVSGRGFEVLRRCSRVVLIAALAAGLFAGCDWSTFRYGADHSGFNPSENTWMGWERKRGKIEEFNRLLRGATDTSYVVQTGSAMALEAKLVLTLDADTVLPRDAARRMIATLAHPPFYS